MRRFLPAVGLVAAIAVVPGAGCVRSGGEPGTRADAAILGTVRLPHRVAPVAGRVVHAVNTATGESIRGTTNDAGRYEMAVPPGRYEVNVVLLPGEALVNGPGIVDVGRTEPRVRADFVLGTTVPTRPRPRPRQPAVLGAPSA